MDVMMLSVLGEFDDDQIENKDGFQNSFGSFCFSVSSILYMNLETIFSIVL